MAFPLIISPEVLLKLSDKHGVSKQEVEQCFLNRGSNKYVLDKRKKHETDRDTWWFIGNTDRGRNLLVAFVIRESEMYLRTAYDADEKTIEIYQRKCEGQK